MNTLEHFIHQQEHGGLVARGAMLSQGFSFMTFLIANFFQNKSIDWIIQAR